MMLLVSRAMFAQLLCTTGAVHVAFIAPPASHYAPMLPIAHGLLDEGHQVSFIGFEDTVKKINKVVPRAETASIGPMPMDREKVAPVFEIIQGLPYKAGQFFTNVVIHLMGVLLGADLARLSKPILTEMRPDVLCVSFAYPLFYALAEVLQIPVVGIGWGTPSWMTSHVDMPWAVEPNVGSIHTRSELHSDPLLLAENTILRIFGWVMLRLGTLVNDLCRFRIGHNRALDASEFDVILQHPMVTMTLPELTAGNPTLLGPYTFMIGIVDHPALGGSGMAKSDDQEKIMGWLDDKQRAGVSVLYVAFGSEVRINAQTSKVLAEAFRLGGFTVLWATKVAPQAELPDGVLVTKFAPQRAVLNHPAVFGFLSHGGMNSVNEALAFGKPMAIMPFFGDQMMVAAVHRDLGVAVLLDKTATDPRDLVSAISEISTDRYRNRSLEVKELNDQRRDLTRGVQVVVNQATGRFRMHIPPCPSILRLLPLLATLALLAGFCGACCCVRCRLQPPCCCRGPGAGARKKQKTQ